MEWQATAVDTSTDSTTVNDDPTLVKGVFVNTTLSNHAVVIKDGSTAKYTIPAKSSISAQRMTHPYSSSKRFRLSMFILYPLLSGLHIVFICRVFAPCQRLP